MLPHPIAPLPDSFAQNNEEGVGVKHIGKYQFPQKTGSGLAWCGKCSHIPGDSFEWEDRGRSMKNEVLMCFWLKCINFPRSPHSEGSLGAGCLGCLRDPSPRGVPQGSKGVPRGPSKWWILVILGDFRPLRCQISSGAMRTPRHRSFLALGRPKNSKNVQKSSVSIDFWVQKFLLKIWLPCGGPRWDFWGSGPRAGKGFDRRIERRPK